LFGHKQTLTPHEELLGKLQPTSWHKVTCCRTLTSTCIAMHRS